MVKSVFMAVVAVACVLLGMVLMVGFSSCSHASSDFIGDNPDTRYYGISGGGESEPEVPAPAPIPAAAPAPVPPPPPKRYTPLIRVYRGSNNWTQYDSRRVVPSYHYTTSSGKQAWVETYSEGSGKVTRTADYAVRIYALDPDTNIATNVTSECTFTCHWTLTPNPTYEGAPNPGDTYAVMNGPDDTHTCSYTVTRPAALGYTDLSQPQYTLNPDHIYIPDPNSTGFIEVTANVHRYSYALHLAVDVTLDSSTVLFDTSLPVNEHWECTPIEVFNINKNDPDPWNQSSTPNP